MTQFTKNPSPGLPGGMTAPAAQDAANTALTQVYSVVSFGTGAPTATPDQPALYINQAGGAGTTFYHAPGNGSAFMAIA